MLAFRDDRLESSPLSLTCCSPTAEVKLSEMSARAPEADFSMSLTLRLCPAQQPQFGLQSYIVLSSMNALKSG